MAEHGYSSGPLGARDAGSRRRGDLEAGITCGGTVRPTGSSESCAVLGPHSPRAGGGGVARFFLDPVFDDEQRHFLDACFLCRTPLPRHRDIYMYRGDTPFCSEECRQEQIEMDEAKEKNWSLSMKKPSTSRKEQPKQTEKAPQGIQVRAAGAVLAV